MFLQYPQKLWHFLFCGGEGIERVWEYPKNPKSNLPCVAAHALLAIPREWQAKQN